MKYLEENVPSGKVLGLFISSNFENRQKNNQFGFIAKNKSYKWFAAVGRV